MTERTAAGSHRLVSQGEILPNHAHSAFKNNRILNQSSLLTIQYSVYSSGSSLSWPTSHTNLRHDLRSTTAQSPKFEQQQIHKQQSAKKRA